MSRRRLYYKDLKTYIFNSIGGRGLLGRAIAASRPGDPTTYTEADANRMGVSTLKVERVGGYVQGVEVTASIPFSLFSEALDGFGFIVSGAKNKSRIEINDDRDAGTWTFRRRSSTPRCTTRKRVSRRA